MLSRVLLSSLLASGAMAQAQQAANFNITADMAAQAHCGQKCQDLLLQTQAIDIATVGQDFDFDFYATSSNFTSSSKPGDLLKMQAVDPNTRDIKAGTTVYRIQYASKRFDGSTSVSTGYVAIPFNAALTDPSNGAGGTFKVAAIAPGTIGIYRGCAPSNGPNFFDYDTWKPLVERGYMVVSTDYAGIGNNHTGFQYGSFPAHANDVFYAVQAARKAFGQVMSKQWMSLGHSLGGAAAWKLAESEHVRHDANYLGTVALGPTTYLVDMILDSIDQRELAGHIPLVATTLANTLPSYRETILSDETRLRMQLAEKTQMCAVSMLSVTRDMEIPAIYNHTGLQVDGQIMRKWQNESSPALGDISPAPILVVHGLADTTVVPDIVEKAWKRSCDAGNKVQLSLYRLMDHTPVVSAAGAEWIGFMDKQFAKKKRNSSHSDRQRCTKVVREPFDEKFVKAPKEFSL
ncbi:hypothetical protein VHEMI00014 [[Torrubiella] hemipterigena]|uniref:Serine aminopeptidase S33 domain-containing protein n=1 Tax=[Torrubiella] hemipterigena TaxID=1531966 RepID=A0A0A1T103_9HYPO|nr:hypothetical protein VHEMI00014 [[Torrubiella] hemipterigena]